MTDSENIRLSKALNDVQDLYDNAPVGYHSIDKTGLITRINNIHLKWLGYLREEVEGKMNVKMLFKDVDSVRFEAQFELLKQQGLMKILKYISSGKTVQRFPFC